MPFVPPWLAVAAPDFAQARSSGAQAGLGLARANLERAQLQQQAAEAAARIGLAYAQMNAERESAGEKLKAAMQEHEMLQNYRQQQEESRKRQLDIAQQRADQAGGTSAAEKLIHAGTGIYGYDPKSGSIRTIREPSATVDPLAKFDLQKAQNDIRDARREYLSSLNPVNQYTPQQKKDAARSEERRVGKECRL